MKLNISMIAEWLKEYDPLLTIIDGGDEIEGLQFLSGGIPKDNQHIYIGRAEEFKGGGTSEEIILAHKNDVICVWSQDMDEISSKVIECFEFYNTWETKIFESAGLEHPEQLIIDACGNLIGPILILDLKLNLIAYSKNYAQGEVNKFWDDFLQYERVSIKSKHIMNTSDSNRLMPIRHKQYVYEELEAAPYSHGIMISYCDINDNLIGQCVLTMDHPATARELCMAKSIEAALNSISHNKTDNALVNFAQSIVIEALSSGTLTEFDKKRLITLMDWNEETAYQITVCIVDGVEANSNLMSYLSDLSEHFNKAVGLVFRGQLVFCHQADISAENRLVSAAESVIPLFAGVSAEYRDIAEMAICHRQATIAALQGAKRNQSFTHFSNCALRVLVSEPDREFCKQCIHPGVRFLNEYDERMGTSYGSTLQVYLQQERSYLLTSRQIHVHRNTVVYRLERILEMYHFDLDDPDEREYILYSFRLLIDDFC